MSDEAKFDYVIVGAGSAGCVLANRLTEDPTVRVCLIEAGPRDRSPLIHIPAGVVALMNHRVLNWRFATAEQADAAQRTIPIPRGRTLGGSSSINGMVYMRGQPADYDDWAAAGNAGWSYREVLPCFLKSENNATHGESPFHGDNGPLRVSDLARRNPLTEVFHEAASSLQMRFRDDFNGEDQEGYGYRQVTIHKGRRQSTATALLKSARSRPNLEVMTDADVRRVLLDGKRVTGVEIVEGRTERRLAAAREVILAAGAIGSPLILQRSGIGPVAELAAHGIEPVHELPGVGQNLQDHISAAIRVASPDSVSYAFSLRAMPRLAGAALQYALFRRGFFAGNLIEGGGFVRTDSDLERSDIQLTFLPGLRNQRGGVVGAGHGYTLTIILLRPESRGHVGLSGASVDAPPVIDPQFYSAGDDLARLTRGFEFGRRICQAPAFARHRKQELEPGPDVQTETQLQQYIRNTAATIFHPIGTCKMGGDADAVVDDQLRVRGVESLRVVDAAIMPTIVGGNTNAPTIMIAEKAADMIRGRPPLPPAQVSVEGGRAVFGGGRDAST